MNRAAFAAIAYNRLFVFGDSLSDTGTYTPVARGARGGKFTTNPGQLWIEIIADKLGRQVQPNRFEGFKSPLVKLHGTNYAQGGARVTLAVPPTTIPAVTARSLTEQFDIFFVNARNFTRRI